MSRPWRFIAGFVYVLEGLTLILSLGFWKPDLVFKFATVECRRRVAQLRREGKL